MINKLNKINTNKKNVWDLVKIGLCSQQPNTSIFNIKVMEN